MLHEYLVLYVLLLMLRVMESLTAGNSIPNRAISDNAPIHFMPNPREMGLESWSLNMFCASELKRWRYSIKQDAKAPGLALFEKEHKSSGHVGVHRQVYPSQRFTLIEVPVSSCRT